MYQPTAFEVNTLRKKTGSGIMDCKKSLIQSMGNFEEAIAILRKKGQTITLHRSEYKTNEGVLIARINNNSTKGVILGLHCETDFVAKNPDFIKFVHYLAQFSLMYNNKEDFLLGKIIKNIRVKEKILEKISIIGEKIELSTFEVLEANFIASYIHHGNKIGALVGFSIAPPGIEQIGKNIAMQVVAMNPLALTKKTLSSRLIEKEKNIAKEQLKKDRQSEHICQRIIEGKLKKFISENTLMSQSFIKNHKLSVSDYLKSMNPNIRIMDYKRIAL